MTSLHFFLTFPRPLPRFVRALGRLSVHSDATVYLLDTNDSKLNRFARRHYVRQVAVRTTHDHIPFFGSILNVAHETVRRVAPGGIAIVLNGDISCPRDSFASVRSALGAVGVIGIAQRLDVESTGAPHRHADIGHDLWMWNVSAIDIRAVTHLMPPFRFGFNDFDTWFLARLYRTSGIRVIDATYCGRCVHHAHGNRVYSFADPRPHGIHSYTNRYLALHTPWYRLEDGHPCRAPLVCQRGSPSRVVLNPQASSRCVYARCDVVCWRRRQAIQRRFVEKLPESLDDTRRPVHS